MKNWNEKPSYGKLMLHLSGMFWLQQCHLNYIYTAQYCSILLTMKLHEAFKFIIEDQHQGTSSTSEYIREGTLEE